MNDTAKRKTTAFLTDETCFWHAGGSYAFMSPVGGLVQPLVAGGLPEAPETKRRLKNLIEVTGLAKELHVSSAPSATDEQLLLVHPQSYLDEFRTLSGNGGGELGLRTPFGPGAYEIAAKSAGLVVEAVRTVASSERQNAYALSRPPGHHCLPDWPNGFCLLANIAVAVKVAIASKWAERIAIVDWDVHHGNGTEAIFFDDPNVLTISVHQDRCYPMDTGFMNATGEGAGTGCNVNIPLQPGAGHKAYMQVMDQIVVPKLSAFNADLTIVASGYDASGVDPLSRMMCTSQTFQMMTKKIMDVCGGRFVAAHEGGYSELHVPFCGHAVISEMSNSSIHAEDPLQDRLDLSQPSPAMENFHSTLIDEMAVFFAENNRSKTPPA